MLTQSMLDQDEDVLMLNPDPETADLYDDEDDFDEDDAEFDELGSGAASGYGDEDLADLEEDEEFDDELSDDEDDFDDDLDDDSME